MSARKVAESSAVFGAASARWRARWLQGLVAVLVAAAVSAPEPVAADTPDDGEGEAKAMFEAGRRAYADGRYADALQRWEVAYHLSQRPALQYNLGLAHERLGHVDEAIAAFETYLGWQPDGERAERVRGKLATLRVLQKAARRAEETPPATEATAPTAAAPADAPPPAGPQGPAAAVEPSDAEDDDAWYGKWYVWAGAGAVVAGVVAAVLLSSQGGKDGMEPETTTVQALRMELSP